MPNVRWTRPAVRRVIRPFYVWERENGWECYVRPADYLEVITNEGFERVDEIETTRLTGVDEALARELEVGGVVTLHDLMADDAAEIAQRAGIDAAQIAAWQEQVRTIEPLDNGTEEMK